MKKFNIFQSLTPIIRTCTVVFAFCCFVQVVSAQQVDSMHRQLNIRGAVSVTNNGFSFIPSFSLGRPASIINLSVSGKRRLSFEPEFRYALDGKPWSFIFIWRYKLIRSERFQLTAGTHLPALNFKTVSVEKNGVVQDVIQTSRFFPVLEVMPYVPLNKNTGLGLFYLYGHGVEKDITQHTHFLAFRAVFNHIPLVSRWYLRWVPQTYYLKSDSKDGFYAASNLTLARSGFPLAISSMLNKSISTTVPGKAFDWNVSLVYQFHHEYNGR